MSGLSAGPVKLFGEGIEMKIVSAEGGASELTLDVKPSHRNAVGVAHGGAIFTLIDSGMACALIPLLTQGQTCLTVEVKVNNVAPVREGLITARSVVSHKGRTIAHVESDVRNAHGRLIAKGLGTFFVRTPATSRDAGE